MQSLQQLLTKSPDLIILGFAIVLVFFYSITFATRKSAHLLVSFYITRTAMTMTESFLSRQLRNLSAPAEFTLNLILLVIFTILIFWAFSNIFTPTASRKSPWLWAILLNLAVLGLFLATVAAFWSQTAFNLSPITQKLFVSGEAQIVWFWLPLILLVFYRFKPKLFGN